MIRTLLVSALVLTCQTVFGSTPAERGDSAYNAGNFNEAIGHYQTSVNDDGTSAALLYNLGNAQFQTGDYGNAMANWVRARRLEPGNSRINANINYLQSKVEDQNKAEQRGKRMEVTPDEPSFFQSLHKSLAADVASDTWGVLAAICFVLFVAAVALYMFTRNVAARKTGFFGGMVLVCLSVAFVSLAFMSARAAQADDEGVITAFKVTLLTEPTQADKNKGNVLTKGTRVHVISVDTDALGNPTWVKVRLNSNYIGWVSAKDVVVI